MIRVEKLSKTYAQTEALRSISFEVPPGQVCGHLGPNGAGKTTTVRILTGVLSIVLFARVDTYFFVLVSLAASMLVTATSLIVEYDEAVLDPEDLEVIGHLPVPVRTYSAARVANLMVYLLLVIASMNVFPAIAALGHRDTTLLYLPTYVAATLAANLLVAGLVVLAYTWFLGGRPGTAAREVLAWTQVVLILVFLVFVYGGPRP